MWHFDQWFLSINHFQKQQQQPAAAAAATTGCSYQNTFLGCSVCEIHNEQSSPLSRQQQLRCPWGAHFAPDSSSGAAPWPAEQKQCCKNKPQSDSCPVLSPPRNSTLLRRGGDGGAMRQHLCIHYCLDNTIKPSGNSFFTAGYSTDLQRRKTLAFKIRMSWMQETD